MRERKGGAWTHLLLMKARKAESRLPVGVLERNHVTAGYSNPLGSHGWSATCPRATLRTISLMESEVGPAPVTSDRGAQFFQIKAVAVSKTPSELTAIRCAMLASCVFCRTWQLSSAHKECLCCGAHAMRDGLDVDPCSLLLSAPYVRRRIASQGLATGVC
jgi:hypothetical protein